ncbi:PLP-dependent aminotransferase family protein [Bacillus thuringiensis]|uniref:aminotransferase-like domain-containing protein n=1 Tax=Bacillus cereus group TaxID=86661 RepID=UPI000BECF3C6|nr:MULTISPECIES: PLP-dependent aminotransferase family protein [Bacillus cereus group]MCC6082067.1 PLP-dependent aminotransferase family protein [Bacillus thuringiensis]MED3446807.1 PLP-dependent aminotransferase family protein [Bacillus thuringiensis]PEB54491.1 GntR family transcriptional regulator [Bacillus cereus]PEB85642.1 GntR family transcriptional regulator [Bacillus thuringiensis]PGK93095.1 GntR family transcriptional regulator [Bacillus thuringiensis]
MISVKAKRMINQINPINELLNITEGVISFAGGLPSLDLLESHAIYEIMTKTNLNELNSILQYGEIEGDFTLRQMISKRALEYGIHTTPAEIVITSGATQGIDFVSELFINSEDYILVDQYSFVSAIEIFKSYGAIIIPVQSDENGIIIDDLEKKLKEFSPKFIYIVPNYNNPTGFSLSMERRERLLDIIHGFEVFIIEDDPYLELYYEDSYLPPLKALDKKSKVIYLSSFSKTISPGLRVGYMIGNSDMKSTVIKLKENKDIHTSNLSQFLVLEFLKGDFEKHLDILRQSYKQKRDVMDYYLKYYLGSLIRYSIPTGGMFFWIKLQKGIDSMQLLKETLKHGVTFIPGQSFCTDFTDDSAGYLRLNFTNPDEHEIKQGLEVISRCIEGLISQPALYK